ncbi:MAG: flagellar type III secretion system protein FliR [Vallitaleaceae bacterium]|nr:flagellar type III secretion system protein FliR [Vallitaleaceae bacterium]
MDLLLSDPYRYLDAFLLVFVRIISLFIAVPIFSNRSIPPIVKISLAFFLSCIVINVIDTNLTVSSTDVMGYLFALVKEIFVGWIIGFAAYIVFSILTLAGQLIDTQVGFSMVNVFDPMSQVQFTISGTFYYYLVLLIVLVTNSYHFFIRAMMKSFEWIPIGDVALTANLYNSFTGILNEIFIIALQIAAPFFFVMLLTDIVLGLLARTAPQMNLFVIGFPVKIFLGLVVMLLTINVFSSATDMIMDKTITFIDNIIRGMAP